MLNSDDVCDLKIVVDEKIKFSTNTCPIKTINVFVQSLKYVE